MNKEEKIDIGFDAVLENSQFYMQYGKLQIIGNIFDDQRKRFTSGQRVTTSLVTDIVHTQIGIIVHTMNTKYLIVGGFKDVNEKTYRDIPEVSERQEHLYPPTYFDGVIDTLLITSILNTPSNNSTPVLTNNDSGDIINTVDTKVELEEEINTFTDTNTFTSMEPDTIIEENDSGIGSMFSSIFDSISFD